MKPCDEVRDKLSSYLDGALSEAERTAVERHVGSCVECRGELELMRATVHAVSSLPRTHAPAGFEQRVMARVRVEAHAQRTGWGEILRSYFLGPQRWLRIPVAAAAVVAVAVVAWNVSVLPRTADLDGIEMKMEEKKNAPVAAVPAPEMDAIERQAKVLSEHSRGDVQRLQRSDEGKLAAGKAAERLAEAPAQAPKRAPVLGVPALADAPAKGPERGAGRSSVAAGTGGAFRDAAPDESEPAQDKDTLASSAPASQPPAFAERERSKAAKRSGRTGSRTEETAGGDASGLVGQVVGGTEGKSADETVRSFAANVDQRRLNLRVTNERLAEAETVLQRWGGTSTGYLATANVRNYRVEMDDAEAPKFEAAMNDLQLATVPQAAAEVRTQSQAKAAPAAPSTVSRTAETRKRAARQVSYDVNLEAE